jgi:hypothetical protein
MQAEQAYVAAARWFEKVAGEVTVWDDPGLGEWSLRDLVGHTSRALLTVETYLATPATAIEVESSAEYFRIAMASLGDPAAVSQRGRDAGAALGEHPAEAVTAIVERVLPLIEAGAPGFVLQTPVGGMRLVDYLPTRTFELTVHTCDIAAALGRPIDPPPAAAATTLRLLGELAAGGNSAGQVMLALTGRGSLPAGFTVL